MKNDRLAEEAAFADAQYVASVAEHGLSINPVMFAKYTSPSQMWDWRQRVARIIGDLSGKALLDYGCGQGEEAVYFAKLGAKVSAIDISSAGIAITRESRTRECRRGFCRCARYGRDCHEISHRVAST